MTKRSPSSNDHKVCLVNNHVDKIGVTAKTIFARSTQIGKSTSHIADKLAEQILASDIDDGQATSDLYSLSA